MTATQEETMATGPDRDVDRALWVRLRRAAYKGQLQPEGDQLVQQLHRLYPEWRQEW